MDDFDDELDDLAEFLIHCYELKKKAELVRKQKRSLPKWMEKLLLINKPSQN